MREIKFRAWDKEKQCMIIGHWSWYLSFDGRIWKSNVSEEEKGYILMQFTGLKDKNGKEIYENDIVKEINISDGKHIREIVFEQGCFWTKGQDKRVSEAFVPLSLEVIGNVYENPELLKK